MKIVLVVTNAERYFLNAVNRLTLASISPMFDAAFVTIADTFS